MGRHQRLPDPQLRPDDAARIAPEPARDVHGGAQGKAGHSESTIADLLGQWIVSKHVYVAPTDEEARAEAEGPEKWYLDAFARSIRPTGLRGISEAVRQQATAAADRAASHRWEELVEDRLFIGSPETVRRKIEELRAIGVGEMICWMSFGGLPPEKVRRSMELFADRGDAEFSVFRYQFSVTASPF